MTFYVGNNGIIEYRDMPPEAGSGRVIFPSDAQVLVNGNLVANIIQVAVTKELESILQSFSFTLKGSQAVDSAGTVIPISTDGTCIVEIKQGYGGSVQTIFKGFVERRHDPHAPISVHPVITGLSPLGRGASPWSERIKVDWKTATTQLTTLEALFRFAFNKILWGGFSAPSFDGFSSHGGIPITDYNTVGKFPIEVMTDLLSVGGFQLFVVEYDHVNNRVQVVPKTLSENNPDCFSYTDFDDIYLIDESMDYSEEFNFVDVFITKKKSSSELSESNQKVIIGYEPVALGDLFSSLDPPILATMDGDDWNEWLEYNQSTMAGEVLGEDFSFDDNKTRLPIKERKAPASPDCYTNIEPDHLFFGGEEDEWGGSSISIFNAGLSYKRDTVEMNGGKEEKTVDDNKNPISYSYSGAEFVQGTGALIDYVKIPWKYKDNPDYSEEDQEDGVISTFSIFGVIKEESADGQVTGSAIEDAVVEIEFADTVGSWIWYQHKNNSALKIRVWAGTIDGVHYTKTVQEEIIEDGDWTDITATWILTHPIPADPDISDINTQTSNSNGEVAFRGVPYAHYLAKASHPAYDTVADVDKSEWNIVADKFTLIREAGGDVISDKKYILLDTDYNWIATAEIDTNTFGTENPSGEEELDFITVKRPSALSGQIYAPAMRDPLITTEAFAFFVGQTFLQWSQAKKQKYKLTCPHNPFLKPGDKLYIDSDVIGFHDNVYIMNIYIETNPVEQKDVIDCWRFV